MPQIIACSLSRWQVEVTFAEARTHLGFQAQRRWSTRAVRRTTPGLRGLFGVVPLLAYRLSPAQLPTRRAAWYTKGEPTFTDALAVIRRHLWAEVKAPIPVPTPAPADPPSLLTTSLMETARYAA